MEENKLQKNNWLEINWGRTWVKYFPTISLTLLLTVPTLDDSVEIVPVVVASPGVRAEILHSFWRLVRKQVDVDVPVGGVDDCPEHVGGV
jgi:hypothetical protein